MLTNDIRKLDELIKDSNNILITSHQGPDPDAISCTAFTFNILKFNYPEKQIYANIDSERMNDLKDLINIEDITTLDWSQAIDTYKPDLLIICDLSSYKLLSSNYSAEKFSKYHQKGMKVVVIDHHPKEDEVSDLYINNFDSSCAETVFEVFVKQLKLKPYSNYQNHLLLGIIADTGSFAWADKNTKHCFDTAKELVLSGGSIDKVQEIINKKSLNTVKIHAEYLNNLESNGEYTYSYISDDFKIRHPEVAEAEFTTANKQFTYTYLKYIGSAKWGFTIKPKGEAGLYSISFRAQINILDTTKFTTHLNGNGHKSSSGGIIQANSSKEAVSKVIEIIEKHKVEAYANK